MSNLEAKLECAYNGLKTNKIILRESGPRMAPGSRSKKQMWRLTLRSEETASVFHAVSWLLWAKTENINTAALEKFS